VRGDSWPLNPVSDSQSDSRTRSVTESVAEGGARPELLGERRLAQGPGAPAFALLM